jgi:hypothetical protein
MLIAEQDRTGSRTEQRRKHILIKHTSSKIYILSPQQTRKQLFTSQKAAEIRFFNVNAQIEHIEYSLSCASGAVYT